MNLRCAVMSSTGRSGRGSSKTGVRSSPRGRSQDRHQGGAKGRPSPPSGGGPGILLVLILLLGGSVLVLLRSGALSVGGLLQVPDDTPACPAAVNRWADQRLEGLRVQLQREHGLYRADGEALNAIGSAMNWIDDRIIDQRVGEERQQLRRSLLGSARCLVQFQP